MFPLSAHLDAIVVKKARFFKQYIKLLGKIFLLCFICLGENPADHTCFAIVSYKTPKYIPCKKYIYALNIILLDQEVFYGAVSTRRERIE